MPSTTNRKEKINKFFGNVNLYLIDCPYEDFTKYSAKGFQFLPQDLESRVTNERKIAREILEFRETYDRDVKFKFDTKCQLVTGNKRSKN